MLDTIWYNTSIAVSHFSTISSGSSIQKFAFPDYSPFPMPAGPLFPLVASQRSSWIDNKNGRLKWLTDRKMAFNEQVDSNLFVIFCYIPIDIKMCHHSLDLWCLRPFRMAYEHRLEWRLKPWDSCGQIPIWFQTQWRISLISVSPKTTRVPTSWSNTWATSSYLGQVTAVHPQLWMPSYELWH